MPEDQAQTIEFLSRPDSYQTVEPVERHETHAAIVFLAGALAYKLKRAVRYSYLDYSTVARRRAMCEAELAVNRRTAPDLYIRVLPIVRDRGRLRFGVPGDAANAADWVVVMRRFAETDLLEQKLRTGEVSTGLFRELAGEIARFHKSADSNFVFGGSAGIGRTIAESTDQMEAFAHRPFDPATVERFASLAANALERVSALLDRRKRNGFVRRCHGDLHLNNVCIPNGRPVLFDAIEFNDDFSNIDVFYDLAFLLMGLDRRHARWAANVVLNRYLEITSDYEGAGPLPLFLACRAAVRAHVAATTAAVSPEAAGPILKEAVSLLQRAVDYLTVSESPLLIAIGGVSGSGKSVLARILAPHAGNYPGAVVLRSDVIRKRLFGVADEFRLPASAYAAEVTERVYSELRDRAELLLRTGHSVIADAVHGAATERDLIRAVAERAGARFAGIWLEAEPSLIEQRLGRRTGDASDADVKIAMLQLAQLDRPEEWTTLKVSQGTPDECVSAAAAILKIPGEPGTWSVHD